jgi:hypothetical protein
VDRLSGEAAIIPDEDRAVSLEAWELASYVVTVVGLPFAIAVFLYEQRK